MDWTLTAAQARALYFLENVTDADVDDDLSQAEVPEWPPLLRRREAARFLGIGMNQISSLSGNGPKGGRLSNRQIKGRVYWTLVDLQAYAEERQQGAARSRDTNGRYLKTGRIVKLLNGLMWQQDDGETLAQAIRRACARCKTLHGWTPTVALVHPSRDGVKVRGIEIRLSPCIGSPGLVFVGREI